MNDVSIGDLAMARRDWRTAADAYRAALSKCPDNPAIWVQLGHAEKEQQNFNEAIDAYRRAIALNNSDIDARFHLADLFERHGRFVEAANAFAAIVEMDSTCEASQQRLFDLLPRLAHQDSGYVSRFERRTVDQAVKFHIELGDRFRDAGNWSQAAHAYRNALFLQPSNGPIWVQHGHAEKESGNLGKAHQSYQMGQSLLQNDADANLHYGIALRGIGELEKSAEILLKSFEQEGKPGLALAELIVLMHQAPIPGQNATQIPEHVRETVGFFSLINRLSEHRSREFQIFRSKCFC